MTAVAEKVTRTGKRLNPQRRKAVALAAKAEEALAFVPEILVYPNQLQVGDILTTGEDRAGNPYWNSDAKAIEPGSIAIEPRGCRGKTHVNSDCYENIVPVWVKRRPDRSEF